MSENLWYSVRCISCQHYDIVEKTQGAYKDVKGFKWDHVGQSLRGPNLTCPVCSKSAGSKTNCNDCGGTGQIVLLTSVVKCACC